MPDPLQSLDSLRDAGDGVRPLPAHEVRRRGDSLRRRRTTALVLGSAAVVAAVAVGGASLGSSRTDSVPPATQSPSGPTSGGPTSASSPTDGASTEPPATLLTRIPASFPLNDGWPRYGDGESEMTEPSDSYMPWTGERTNQCGDPVPQPDSAGRLTSIWTGLDSSRSRELLTFDSVAGAEQWSADLRAVYEACPRTPDPDVPADRVTRVRELGLSVGDDTWEAAMTLVAGGEVVPGQSLVQVTRLGHVVLVDYGSDPGTDVRSMSSEYATQSDGVLRAACERLDACAGASGDGQGAGEATGATYDLTAPDAPASELVGQGDVPDLPLRDGLPDMTGDGGELLGPAADVQGVDRLLACGTPLVDQDLAISGRLAASSSGPEYLAYRQVVSFATVEAAQAQMAHVRELVPGCGRQGVSEDSDVIWTLLDADTGYDTFTTGYGYYRPGSDEIAGTGGEVVQLTRVGRAVLVVGSRGEYAGEDSLQGGADELTALSRDLAPLLCSFTEAGC